MPEYRRFISYFYEYTDGKKQKNAGFAKVELRNGMWRIFLKLTAQTQPEAPIQVYGFVREPGYLQGVLLGTIRPVQEIAEEWAFRADAPVGEGKYRLGDLAGIWVESSDGRRFATVWDDEGIEQQRFVKEPAEAEASEAVEVSAEAGAPEAAEASAGVGAPEAAEASAGVGAPEAVEASAEAGTPEAVEASAGAGTPEAVEVLAGAGAPEAVEASAGAGTSETVEFSVEMETSEIPGRRANGEKQAEAAHSCDIMEELLGKRTPFQPFSDGEIGNCVMILPCDIVRLQQENWKVGRSSFLQHGFYQYRHLLLGKSGDGTYILGVPGVRDPQETYMAQMFGYDRFRESPGRNCGKTFGYWCRELRKD